MSRKPRSTAETASELSTAGCRRAVFQPQKMQVGSSSISANSSQRLACGPRMEPLASIPVRVLTARGCPVQETSRHQGAPPLEHEVAVDEYADFTKEYRLQNERMTLPTTFSAK